MNYNINAVIVDDESLAREIVKKHLTQFPQINIIAECSNGFEGVKAINELKPDILFLDIQMPKLTGFEMLEILEHSPAIIFTTAYDQYAIKAFEVSAIDYLLKPFPFDRFKEAVEKALLFIHNKKNSKQQIRNLLENTNKQTDYLDRIVVKDGSTITLIQVENLLWIEAQDDYVLLHTKEGKHLKQQTMKYYEFYLNPKDFIRIHRSYIVRIEFINQVILYEKDSYRVVLKNDKVLPTSKPGYIKLKDILKL
jgi:two-component system LytT family response regulator